MPRRTSDTGTAEERLLQCIRTRQNDQVQKLLRTAGEDVVRYTTKEGVPILHEAILYNNTAAAKLLLAKGADPCSKNSAGQTALHAAAKADDVPMLIDLHESCGIHTPDQDGNTPLHIAVRNTSTGVIKWLVFLGADTLSLNKNNDTCRSLTKRHQVKLLLREENPNRPEVCLQRLERSRAFKTKGMPFSIQLAETSESSPIFAFSCSSLPSLATDSFRLLNLKEDEEGWGPVVEYLSTEEAEVALTFPLNDLPPHMCEVVLRVVDTTKDTTRHVTPSISQAPTRMPETVIDDIMAVALAYVPLKLDESGLLQLVCRPVKQSVFLKDGKSSVKSVVDDRVQLTMTSKEVIFKGELQLEPSPPVKEQPALYAAPATRQAEYESQSNYVSTRTSGESAARCSLNIKMPLPDDYNGGPIQVYMRNMSLESDVGDFQQMAGEGFYSVPRNIALNAEGSDSGTDSEVDREADRWEKAKAFEPQSAANAVTVPVVPNKTMTLIETSSKPVTEGRQKAAVARRYLKRRRKKCLFFVAARSLESWRECQEVLVVVTSPTHLAAEFGRHLTDRYCFLAVSGQLEALASTQFYLNIVGNVFIHKGTAEGIVTFTQTLRQQDTSNKAYFVLRLGSERATEARISIHQKLKKGKLKYKGELRFDLGRIDQVWRLDGLTQQELSFPFSDQLLLNLVDQLRVAESETLGIRLGLTFQQVDNIMSNHYLNTPYYKCFEILRRARDRSISVVKFGKDLVGALRGMEWNMQCEWLLNQLAEWPQRAEIE